MTPSLFDETGKPLRISKRIGKGGEGEVYTIDGSDLVVKFYTVQDAHTREAKIKLMVSNGLAKRSPLVAFPVSMVFDKSRRFAGFTMAKISSHQPLHELYSPGARKAAFPQANYRFLAISAGNIARAIGATNAAGCVIGDINHSGILVSPTATVTLIDADSFQIAGGGRLFHCKVGVPEYTPPELQGKALSSVVRTENHDAFGLAIAIFQLLFMGRHPYSGRYTGGDMPLEKAIGEFRFAYSTTRSVGMSPPPGVPTLKDFPTTIGQAFEAAFGPSGVNSRPSPKQWIVLLEELKSSLKVCSANSLHHYPSAATECPWCRMEKRFLVPLFLPMLANFDPNRASAPIIGDIVVIWGAIEAVKLPPPTSFPQYKGSTPEADEDVLKTVKYRSFEKILGAVTAIGGFVFLGAIGTSAFVLAILMWGVAWWLLTSKGAPAKKVEEEYRAIQARLNQAEVEWERQNTGADFYELKGKLRYKKDAYDALPAQQKAKIEDYDKNRRKAHLDQYLNTKLIRNFKIPKIGPGRQQVLLSYGIETAADVNEVAVRNVPGFGPVTTQPLLNWRRHLEARFAYNPAQTPADNIAILAIRQEFAQKAAQLRAELGTGPSQLNQLRSAIQAKQLASVPFIQTILAHKAKAVANLEALGVALPHVPKPVPPTVNSSNFAASFGQQQTQVPGGQSARCPSCGGSMVIRTARRGRNAGSKFYGCLKYPACNGTRSFP